MKGERLCLLPLLELSQRILAGREPPYRVLWSFIRMRCILAGYVLHTIDNTVGMCTQHCHFHSQDEDLFGQCQTGTMNQGESEISTRTNPRTALVNCGWFVPQVLCPYARYADTQSFIIDSCPQIILEIIIESFARTENSKSAESNFRYPYR